jgi:hypothetical protein
VVANYAQDVKIRVQDHSMSVAIAKYVRQKAVPRFGDRPVDRGSEWTARNWRVQRPVRCSGIRGRDAEVGEVSSLRIVES